MGDLKRELDEEKTKNKILQSKNSYQSRSPKTRLKDDIKNQVNNKNSYSFEDNLERNFKSLQLGIEKEWKHKEEEEEEEKETSRFNETLWNVANQVYEKKMINERFCIVVFWCVVLI